MSTLQLNTSPIDGDVLRTWRTAQPKRPDEVAGNNSNPYPSQAHIARRIGLGDQLWGLWERRGARGTSAAIARLHIEEGVTLHGYEGVTPEEVEALCGLVGGPEALADEVGVSVSSVGNWRRRGATKISGMLLAYLVDFCGLRRAA